MANTKITKAKFFGTVVDSGAARSCIRINQATALAKTQVADQEICKSNIAFKFGNIDHKSLGKMKVSIPAVCQLKFDTSI